MKTAILLGAVAVANSFVPRSPRHASSGALTLSSEKELDFSQLYNLDGELFNQAEALKTGIQLTKVMRQVTVDYKEEVDQIEKNIVKLRDRKVYIFLAYSCLLEYISTGRLGLEIVKEDAASVDFDNFDNDLMNSCLAKYGMEFAGVDRKSYHPEKKWILTFTLHEDQTDGTESVDMTMD